MSYLALLRSTKAKDPLSQLVLNSAKDEASAQADPIYAVLAELTGHASSMGMIRISTREVYLKLGIPEALRQSASQRVARAMRSLGWAKCRMSRGVPREWGWMRHTYDLSVALRPAAPDENNWQHINLFAPRDPRSYSRE